MFFSMTKLKHGLDIKPAKGFISHFLFLIKSLLRICFFFNCFFIQRFTVCKALSLTPNPQEINFVSQGTQDA